jgi:antitoxin component HigA of HigAB toxin-antitoxin module
MFPCCLQSSSDHENKASECRAVEIASKTEIQENESQKRLLEQEMSRLDTALRELQEAISRCSASEKQASEFVNQAKVLLDQYGIIADRLKQVIGSLDVVQSDAISNPLNWDNLRYVALQSVLNMMTALHEGGFLEACNHDLLNRLKAIEMPVTQILPMELEW